METINTISKILADKLKDGKNLYLHKCLVVCGENSSGKTTLIQKMICELKKCQSFSFYYINPYNRVIYDENCMASKKLQLMTLNSIVENRTNEINLKKDVFDDMSMGAAVVYNALIDSFEYYKKLFEESIGIKLQLSQSDGSFSSPEITINGDKEFSKTSSSEAAKMRLLFEIDYAVSQNAKVIFIDEFDSFLSEDTTVSFLKKLMDKYPNISYVISIQALNPLLQITGFDGALICDTESEILDNRFVRLFDIDSIKDVGQIEKIKRLFEQVSTSNKLEEIIARIVDTGDLFENDVTYIESLSRDNLSGREKILFDYLKEAVSR